MTLDLLKGAVPLANSQGVPVVNFHSGVTWTPLKGKDVDLDYYVIGATDLGGGYAIYGESTVSPYDGGALQHSGNEKGKRKGIIRKKSSGPQTEYVIANMPQVFADINTLVGVVISGDDSSFQQLDSALCTLKDVSNDETLASFLLPINRPENAIVLFVARRQPNNTWTVEKRSTAVDIHQVVPDRQPLLTLALRYANHEL